MSTIFFPKQVPANKYQLTASNTHIIVHLCLLFAATFIFKTIEIKYKAVKKTKIH
jgi:hypothetical protein